MKILIVDQYFWPENFRINDLVNGLLELNHEVVVLTGQPNYPSGRFHSGCAQTFCVCACAGSRRLHAGLAGSTGFHTWGDQGAFMQLIQPQFV